MPTKLPTEAARMFQHAGGGGGQHNNCQLMERNQPMCVAPFPVPPQPYYNVPSVGGGDGQSPFYSFVPVPMTVFFQASPRRPPTTDNNRAGDAAVYEMDEIEPFVVINDRRGGGSQPRRYNHASRRMSSYREQQQRRPSSRVPNEGWRSSSNRLNRGSSIASLEEQLRALRAERRRKRRNGGGDNNCCLYFLCTTVVVLIMLLLAMIFFREPLMGLSSFFEGMFVVMYTPMSPRVWPTNNNSTVRVGYDVVVTNTASTTTDHPTITTTTTTTDDLNLQSFPSSTIGEKRATTIDVERLERLTKNVLERQQIPSSPLPFLRYCPPNEHRALSHQCSLDLKRFREDVKQKLSEDYYVNMDGDDAIIIERAGRDGYALVVMVKHLDNKYMVEIASDDLDEPVYQVIPDRLWPLDGHRVMLFFFSPASSLDQAYSYCIIDLSLRRPECSPQPMDTTTTTTTPPSANQIDPI